MAKGEVFTLIERIRVERWTEPGTLLDVEHGEEQGQIEVLAIHVQHPSNNPAHGAKPGGPPVVHDERILCRGGDLTPLYAYINSLLPPLRS